MSLPRIHAGRRRALLRRLVANGVAQGALAIGLAQLVRAALEGAPHALPWALVAGVVAAGAAALALRAIEAADAERLGQDYVMRVRLRIFDSVSREATGGRRRWGVTMTRLISDLNSLRNWVSAGVARSIVASITIVGVTAALALTHPAALLAVGAMLTCTGIAALGLAPLLRSHIREARRRRGRLANNLGEKVLAAGTVRQFDHDGSERRKVRTHSLWLRDALVRRMRLAQLLRQAPNAAVPVAIGVLLGALAWTDLGMTNAELAVGILLVGLLGTSLADLTRALDHRLAFEEGRQRIEELLSAPRLKERRHPVELEPGGPIAVRVGRLRVRGRLRAGPFEAAAGQTVRVAGGAGAGKSTLLSLVARFLDPDRGRIELDGVPLRRLSLASLGRNVQLIAPEVPLLRGSLLENLTYGSDEIDDEWIAKIADICGLRSGPLAPRGGLEARVDEQGRNLPEGLRARVALARAAAAAPRLLLVDHASLLVDPDGRAALRAVIDLLGCTALIAGPTGPPLFDADAVWDLGEGPSPGPRHPTDGKAPESRS